MWCGLGLAAGLVLLWLGGGVNAPVQLGGPMRLALPPVADALELLAGVAALARLPQRWSRAGWALAIPVLLATVGRNFTAYPPLNDGAWLQLRGMGEAAWPAGPVWTVIGACPLALAVAGLAGRPAPVRAVFAAAAAFCTVGGLAYPVLTAELVANGKPWPFGWLLPVCCAIIAASVRHSLVRAGALVLGALCLLTWALYASVA